MIEAIKNQINPEANSPSKTSAEFQVEDSTETQSAPETLEIQAQRKRSKIPIRMIIFAIIFLVITIAALGFWRSRSVMEVTLIQPTEREITESIASSGRVGAATETNVGAQTSGIVGQIFVREGDQVIRGQRLAVMKNDVADVQIDQARAALNRARAEFAETSRPALSSDVSAAEEQVNQARAQAKQQRSIVIQNERTVEKQQSLLRQRQAERDLAAKEFERVTFLFEKGDYSRSQFDTSQKELRVAENRIAETQKGVEEAQALVNSSRNGVISAEANIRITESRLQSTRTRNSPQQIEVARLRVKEAEESLRVAEEQAQNSDVIAPFAGTVTKINTETGQTVENQGVLSLISHETEIRLSVDESNLPDLSLGQEAVISSNAFSNNTFRATVSEISPWVDENKGTVELTLSPNNPPDWMRQGQTVNINIITNKSVKRLIVPSTALAKNGERTIVLVVENGKAVEKNVTIKTPTSEGVPIVSGLESNDKIIANVQAVKIGDEVRVKS